jgi:hypothetical protein
MPRLANCRYGQRIIGGNVLIAFPLVLILWVLCCASGAHGEDLKSASAHLADQAFALLDHLSKQGRDNPNPLLGAVASLSGDVDSLRQSLAHNDLRSASSDITSLQADRTAVDQALKLHPNAIPAQEWNTLKQRLDRLVREIPPCGTHSECGSAPDSESPPGLAPPGSIRPPAPPRIVMASRESDGGIVWLKGYFEGTALRSAGIYEGSRQLKSFKVNDVPGRQKVEFDLRLEDPSAATVLRITDANDRTAESPIIDPRLQPLPMPPTSEISAGVAPSTAFSDGSETPPKSGDDAGVAEIPSHGPFMPSPSKRHTMVSKLGGVGIELFSVTRTRILPPTYEIVGQITGRGITRAGIYLDGRLIQPIPIIDSANYTSFDQRVVVQGGSMTIRAYSVGNQFVEQSVDLFNAEDASEPSSPYNGAENFPFGGRSPLSLDRNRFSSTPPLW